MKQKDRKPAFALEDWIVEPEFNQLSQGTHSHRVEPKVMSVLVELAGQAQRVVSKDEILRAVWPDTFVGEDALTRCISVLRRVLEDDPHNPRFIKTISKVGYCLLVMAQPVESPHADVPSPEAHTPLDSKPKDKEVPAVVAVVAEVSHVPPPMEPVASRRNGIFVTAAIVLAEANRQRQSKSEIRNQKSE